MISCGNYLVGGCDVELFQVGLVGGEEPADR